MKRLTLCCLAILALSSLVALPGGALPEYDARFLSLEITYTLHADGSWEKEYCHRVRLDTYYSVNRALGETFIVYHPDFQELEVLKSETTMADGRKVPSPANAFNEVLPLAAHGFADYSGLREMVVTHTGLERGAVIDLHYRLRTKAGFLPAFSGREVLTRDFPVDSLSLVIVVPSGTALKHQVFGMESSVGVSMERGEERHAFQFYHRATAAREPLAHPQAEPFIVFSTAADWKQAMALGSDPSTLPAALEGRIEKLKAQYPDRADLLSPQGGPQSVDLLAALQKISATEVQNCTLGIEATGWRPRPVERVALSNYGTRLEKALLLRAMLGRAGIESELLAVCGDAFAPKVPSALQADEFWLKVPGEGAADGSPVLYLDPCREQHEFFPYACHALDAFNLERRELEKLPATDWDQSGVDISGTVRLGVDGASGTLQVAARGSFHRYAEAAADSGNFIAGLLRKFIPVEKAEVKKLLALTRHEIRVEVEFSGQWLKAASAGFFTVDPPHLPGLSENMVIPTRRDSPMLLDPPFKVSLSLELQPETGLRLEYAAPDVDVRREIGYFSRSLAPRGNGSLRFFQGCGIERSLLAPDLYPHLREMLLPYFDPGPWLLLKKEK